MGWLDDAWFDIKDFFGTSDIEKLHNAYKNLVKAFEKDIPKLDDYISTLETKFPQIKMAMGSDKDSYSKGGLVALYDEKYGIFTKRGDDLIAYYKRHLEQMRIKQQEAIRARDHYKNLVDEENRRKEELSAKEAAAALKASEARR